MDVIQLLLEMSCLMENSAVSFENMSEDMIISPILQILDSQYGSETEEYSFFGYLLNKAYQNQDKKMFAEIIRYIVKMIAKEDKQKEIYKELFVGANIERNYYENLLKNREETPSVRVVRFTGKPVVYTAITGNYDNVKEPLHIMQGVDYYLFTNNPNVKSDNWKVIFIDNEEELDNVRLARKIKILGHEILESYDYSIWVDGKLQIQDDLGEYISDNEAGNAILCFNHPTHDCVYQEVELCESLQKDSSEIMQEQINRYRDEGYPQGNGMIDSACLVRDLHDKQLQETMRIWWNEVLHGSRRDQLSFNYSCWKNNQRYDTSKLDIYNNKYFTSHSHNS
ncbi:MAG: DUF616 domain-containing protein [Lachnospiraceae bacterium]|nr:DUF616 domain-containing protein [Lachnospiraceae bacterium]